MKILLTGASGNVGSATHRWLKKISPSPSIYLASRHPKSENDVLFDFLNASTYAKAFTGIDLLFLLRPPQISDVNKYFAPLLQTAKEKGIQKIVFLSVQGVEKSSIIPHHKIEKLIVEGGFHYVFLRPGYFMQNLTTTLLSEIKAKQTISLPAGKAVFNWIDVENIGEFAAHMILHFDLHKNRAYEITGKENLSFFEVAEKMRNILDEDIRYRPMNLLSFFFLKKKQGVATPFILVMIMLHFLPRFQSAPPISNWYMQITGKEPTPIKAFLRREKETFY